MLKTSQNAAILCFQVWPYYGLSYIFPDARIVAAYGDTLSDLPMMEMSEQPVAVYPDAKLRRVAEERGWRIVPTSFR